MKSNFIRIVVSALALVVTISAKAQTTPLSLHDCMAYAISHSTRMRIQQAVIGDARIDRRDAALALFTPTISAQTYAYYNFGRSIDPQTNTYFTTTSFHNNYDINAGYTLFDGFQAVNNYKISKTCLQIAQSMEKQAEADICLAVMEAYCNVVYYGRLREVYEEQVATAGTLLQKALRQEELGQKSHADVVQIEADLADARYNLIAAANQYASQKMTLADLMFWPMDEELVIERDVPSVTPDPINVTPDLIGGLPALQIASWQVLNAKRELNTAQWQLLPTVGFYAGWGTSYYTYQGSQTSSFASQFKNNGGEYIELTLSFPIWSRLSKQSAIRKRRHALEKAQAEYDQKLREVESEVRRAVQDRDGAGQAFLQAQRKAAVQEEAYTLNLKRLEQGLISPIEFQTANNNYLRAQADEMNSHLTYYIKQAVVKYYNGIEYINQ